MAALASRPVRRLRLPGYPTKLEALADPELLARHVPAGWLAQREIAGAVGVFLAANAAGCADDPPGGPRRDPRIAKVAVVAPIFEHGHGQEASGLTSGITLFGDPAPPMYLPEEEAMRVIAAELDRAGLEMSERHVPLNCVIIAGWERRSGYEWVTGELSGFTPVEGPLELDLRDPVRHVAVEYVSAENFHRLGGHGQGGWTQDFKGVSASVGAEVAKQGRGVYFGAFYDPAINLEDGSEERTKAKARELLRQQVKDFVEWLKGQGVI